MKDPEELAFEVWKVTIDVQKHFNDLGMRVRSIAITVLGAFLGAAGFGLKEHSDVLFLGNEVSLTGMILLAALVCWAAFFVMDRLWYHRLLRAAVRHGRKVEDALMGAVPTITLTRTIDEDSPLWGLRAGHRLSIFYGAIAALLWIAAGNSLQAPTHYYTVGTLLLLAVLGLEIRAYLRDRATRATARPENGVLAQDNNSEQNG